MEGPSAWIGPRIGWDEHSSGRIKIEISMELWSNSGRAKHIDIDEQGLLLAERIRSLLAAENQPSDFAIHDVYSYGDVLKERSEPFSILSVGLIPGVT